MLCLENILSWNIGWTKSNFNRRIFGKTYQKVCRLVVRNAVYQIYLVSFCRHTQTDSIHPKPFTKTLNSHYDFLRIIPVGAPTCYCYFFLSYSVFHAFSSQFGCSMSQTCSWKFIFHFSLYIWSWCRKHLPHKLLLKTFALIVSAHPYCARKIKCYVIHRTRGLINIDRADGHCYSFAWI